jgi:hypothetical protein
MTVYKKDGKNLKNLKNRAEIYERFVNTLLGKDIIIDEQKLRKKIYKKESDTA